MTRQNSQHAAIRIEMGRGFDFHLGLFCVDWFCLALVQRRAHWANRQQQYTPPQSKEASGCFLYFAFQHCSSDYRNINCHAPSSASFVSPPEPPADGPAAERRRSQTETNAPSESTLLVSARKRAKRARKTDCRAKGRQKGERE